MDAIKPGDVVMLRSGGPHMTVEELGEHVDAKCMWFAGVELRNEWFPLVVLSIIPTPQASGDVKPSAPARTPTPVPVRKNRGP